MDEISLQFLKIEKEENLQKDNYILLEGKLNQKLKLVNFYKKQNHI